nr:RNA-directed DNA polymerase, eukaryota [Tanacetum cinerariifolium]
MSKLDRFLVSEGIISLFPSISALCLDIHLSDHRPILLQEVFTILARLLSVYTIRGSRGMVLMLWWNMLGIPSLIRIVTGVAKSIKDNLTDIDKNLDRGNVSDELLLKRMDFTRQLLEIKQMKAKDWTDPEVVKDAFKDHFANRFKQPGQGRFKLDFLFPNRLSNDQVVDLDRCISHDEIRGAVWNFGVKSPGPDGFTFEFFRRY